IAEVKVWQTRARRADDMVEDDVGAEALPRVRSDVKEAVDHAEAVGLLVAEAGPDQPPRPAVNRGLTIFDDVGPDRGLLDHVGKVALVHLGHPAAGVTHREIAAEQLILLVRGPRLAGADLQVGMLAEQLALACGRLELGGEHAHGHAGRTFDTAGAVGDRLAAAEADPAERLVELARMAAAQFSEHLPLDLARQIRARRRVRHKELREAKWCAQPGVPRSNGYETLYAAGERR